MRKLRGIVLAAILVGLVACGQSASDKAAVKIDKALRGDEDATAAECIVVHSMLAAGETDASRWQVEIDRARADGVGVGLITTMTLIHDKIEARDSDLEGLSGLLQIACD